MTTKMLFLKNQKIYITNIQMNIIIQFQNTLHRKKIQNAFSQMSLDLTVDEKTFKKFKIDARNELKEIE